MEQHHAEFTELIGAETQFEDRLWSEEIMQLLIIVTSLILTTNGGTIKNKCDLKVNGVYHDLEVLHEDLDRPYLLTVQHSTDLLYFSYSIKDDDHASKAARIHLHTKDFADIKGVNKGFATAVDQKNHQVYIGGSDGIYKYDYANDVAELIGEKNTDIWNMYYKDHLYFSVYPSQFLYVFDKEQSRRFKDLEDTKVDNFVVDGEDIFFTNDTGLFSQKKGTKDAILYQKYHDMGVRALSLDSKGNVYACLQDGIYVLDRAARSVNKIVDLDDAFGVAFDLQDNIIYSDATRIVRLTPSQSC